LESVSDRIKKIRDSKNLSQDSFASTLGLQRNSISLIENGKRNASERTIDDICREFNANKDWLLNGGPEESMFVKLSHDEEVAMYTQDLLMDTDDIIATSIKNFIVIYEKLDDASKQVLQSTMKDFLSKMQKEQA